MKRKSLRYIVMTTYACTLCVINQCVCVFTFIVIAGVTRRKTEVVLEVSPLVQNPGWSVACMDAVLIH